MLQRWPDELWQQPNTLDSDLSWPNLMNCDHLQGLSSQGNTISHYAERGASGVPSAERLLTALGRKVTFQDQFDFTGQTVISQLQLPTWSLVRCWWRHKDWRENKLLGEQDTAEHPPDSPSLLPSLTHVHTHPEPARTQLGWEGPSWVERSNPLRGWAVVWAAFTHPNAAFCWGEHPAGALSSHR